MPNSSNVRGLHRRIPVMGTWQNWDGLVHACFEWYSEVDKTTYWSTRCLQHDQIDLMVCDEVPETVTCIRCMVHYLRS